MDKMTKKSDVPAIRFKGFTDAWEQRKFSDFAQRESAVEVSSPNCPCVEYEDVIAEEGRLNKDIKLKETQKTGIKFDGTQVLYGKLRPYLHNWLNPDFTGVAVGDWWVLRPICIDKDYLYRLIQTKQFDDVANQSAGSKMPRADWNLISNTEFFVPISMEEQSKIAQAFADLDTLITLHQRKLDKLHNVKKSLLEKMFPRNGADVPEIRFSGFTYAWEQCELGSIYELNNERNGNQFPFERTISIATMTFNAAGNGADMSSLPNYKVLRIGDIAFEGHTNKEFRYGRFVLNDLGNGIMSPRFTTLRPTVQQFYLFWKHYIHSERVMRSKLVNSTKAGTMMNELVVDDFFNQTILVPNIEEQERIGRLLSTLDKAITLHQRKLDKLRQIKKSLLEKMFV